MSESEEGRGVRVGFKAEGGREGEGRIGGREGCVRGCGWRKRRGVRGRG